MFPFAHPRRQIHQHEAAHAGVRSLITALPQKSLRRTGAAVSGSPHLSGKMPPPKRSFGAGRTVPLLRLSSGALLPFILP